MLETWQFGAEVEDAAGGGEELGPDEAAGAQPCDQGTLRGFGAGQVGEEQQVDAGAGRRDPGPARSAEGVDGGGFERVGDRDAAEAEPAPQLAGRDRAGE